MRRAAFLVLLLSASARRTRRRYSLKELLDPQESDFALSAYTWEDWDKLDEATKLKAQGMDPAEWQAPPPDADEKKPEKAGKPEKPEDMAPGFRFEHRLELKRKAFEELLGAASAPKLEGLIKQLKLLDKELTRFEKVLSTRRANRTSRSPSSCGRPERSSSRTTGSSTAAPRPTRPRSRSRCSRTTTGSRSACSTSSPSGRASCSSTTGSSGEWGSWSRRCPRRRRRSRSPRSWRGWRMPSSPTASGAREPARAAQGGEGAGGST